MRLRSKHILAASGVSLMLAGMLILVTDRGTCGGILVLGRWSQPLFFVMTGVLFFGLLIGTLGLVLNEEQAKSILEGLTITAITVILLLGGTELLLRNTRPPYARPKPVYISDSLLGYAPAPGGRIHVASIEDGWFHTFNIDRDGIILRGEANVPHEEETRILFIGDSFFAGLQVRSDDNISLQTEMLLNAEDRLPYQAINLGVEGYSPIQYYLMYQNMADRFDPEVVVIGFFVGNDFTGDLNLVLGDRLLYAEDGGVKGVRSPIEDGTLWMDPFNTPVKFEDARQRVVPEEVWRGGWRSILRKTILSPICYRLQAEAVRAAGGMTEAELTNPPQNPAGLSCQSLSGELTEPCESYPLRNESLVRNNSDAIYKEVYTDLDREDMAYALESLRNLTARIEADGRQAVILIIPEAHQIPNQGLGYKWLRGLYPDEIIDSRSPQDLLLEFCMQMGLSCIDLLPVFLEHQDQPLYWPNESHWTPLGHRLAAETLIKHLELPH